MPTGATYLFSYYKDIKKVLVYFIETKIYSLKTESYSTKFKNKRLRYREVSFTGHLLNLAKLNLNLSSLASGMST